MVESLSHLTAKDIMTTEVLTAYEGWSIKRLSSFLVKHCISGVPVIASDHSLVGVVSSSDVIHFDSQSQQEKKQMVRDVYAEFAGVEYTEADVEALAKKADENCTVNQVMTPHVIKVEETTAVNEVIKLMLASKIHRVFVTRDNMMVGVLSTSNILQALVDD
ncbi:CBS domain-containing protein [Bacterioplanoides sp.]|uniref:CBS domain-containing protein n=1 Tax=Bacterioplanoides sp. TaxID=2066072 RepID=UPI003B5ACA42